MSRNMKKFEESDYKCTQNIGIPYYNTQLHKNIHDMYNYKIELS